MHDVNNHHSCTLEEQLTGHLSAHLVFQTAIIIKTNMKYIMNITEQT